MSLGVTPPGVIVIVVAATGVVDGVVPFDGDVLLPLQAPRIPAAANATQQGHQNRFIARF